MSVPAPSSWPQHHLAYVEWFSKPLPSSKNAGHGLFSVTKSADSEGNPSGGIVSLSEIRQTCMLVPDYFSRERPLSWSSILALDQCKKFLINPFQSQYSYMTIY
ncbi:hypothetical protein K435DRAFT_866659 [Dendrothele bispora CBS 962.96]|uniref:Uncharacterized protein n=1 Tax=Dendrothele bispora (strain CBS 962.96) TaxID=1314807 RepID=A0A4S8LG56_DENBC|nr:hypothetical protein K435DRAFT_866659 [Dendrothele bispora CBS 962.96]